MAEYTGSALYLKFGSTVLSSDFRSFDTDESMDLADATAGADTYKNWLSTVADGSATCQLVDQAGGSALWTAIAPGTSGTLEWGEEGTTSTKPKHTVNAVVKGRTKSRPYADVVVLNVSFQFKAAPTDSVY